MGGVAALAVAAMLIVAMPFDRAGADEGITAEKGMQGDKEKTSRPLLALDQVLAAAVKALEAGDTKAALAEVNKARATVAEWRKSGVMCAQCAMAQKAAKGFANVRCPIMNTALDLDKVPAELTRTWKGEKVAFCCAGCPAAWDKLSDAEKDAKLNAVRAPAGVVNKRCPIMGSVLDPAKVPQELTRVWKGQKVGFCCAGCPAAWDRLSDAEKDAKLKAAL